VIISRFFPAVEAHALAEPLVLLHGWGCDSRSWAPLLPLLNQSYDLLVVELPGFAGSSAEASLEGWLAALLEVLPERGVYIGWSLGGMLATRLAARYPERVSGLVTLASNLCFTGREAWPCAMPAATFEQFLQAFAQAPEITIKRFAGLMAAGDANERALLKRLRGLCKDSWAHAQEAHTQDMRTQDIQVQDVSETPIHAWLTGLKLLGQVDNRSAFAALTQPGLHLFAAGDALVPASCCEAMASLNSRQLCETLDGCGHALQLSQPELVGERILTFLRRAAHQVDKRRVAESFSRAAPAYDSVAAIQRQIGDRLLMGMPSTKALTLLDLGSGTGHFTPLLAARCEQQVSLDLAEGMLRFARQQHPDVSAGVCADAEQLPFADDSFHGLFSSLAIQWCANLPQLFAELKRVMKPGATLNIATLGPRTLYELRDAWLAVDNYTHVNDFAPLAALQQALDKAGLTLIDLREEDIVLRYQQVRELTYELKTLGAHNMNRGQSSGLTGRQHVKAFREAYEGFRRDEGWLPATYEVFYLTLRA